jgi:hypothetical protein
VCSACVAGKQLGKNHPAKSVISITRPLELLHLDLFGPSIFDTLGGRRYGLVIVDDYSRYTWVFLLKSKDETTSTSPSSLMTHKYRGSQQSLREVLPKFIDSTQGDPKNICKP